MPGNTVNTPQARLKKRYRDDNRIDRLLYPDNPLSIETCYIQLALIKEKDLKQTQSNDSEKTTDLDRHYWLREYERIENIQEKIELEAIFTSCEKTPRRIYIEGAAGTGKSTLSRRLAYEWSNGSEFLKDYDWVFYLRLRDLTGKEYPETVSSVIESISDQLFVGFGKQLKPVEKEELFTEIAENQNRVLWILDGYDELLPIVEQCAWWQNLINADFDFLITSRPGHRLSNDFRINLKLAVLGFGDEQIEKYIAHFFGPDITSEIDPTQKILFLEYIKKDLNLWSLAHTPIQLELLCSVWDKGLRQKENITLTSLYSLIVDELLKYPKSKLPKIEVSRLSTNDLKEEYEANLCCLEQLAYLGMQRSEILFSKTLIEESYLLLKNKLGLVNKNDFIEKLIVLGIFKYYAHNGSGEFAHLTFQEYFAARHVVKIIRQSVAGNNTLYPAFETFFKEHKFNPQLQIVWWFVTGLLKDVIDTNALEYYFDLLLQSPRDIVVVNELLLFIHCLEQSQLAHHSERGQELFVNSNEQILQLLLLSRAEYLLRRQLISHLELCPLFLTQFVDLQLLPLIKEDQSNSSRRNAVDLLGELGKTIVTKEILTTLIVALGDSDECIRENAADALGKLGEKAATEEIIKALIIALEDPDDGARSSVAKALGKLGEKAVTEEVIRALIAAFKNQNDYGTLVTAQTLGKLGKKAVTEEVIEALIIAFKNQDDKVRRGAAEALGRLGEKAATDEVIKVLISAFNDLDDVVRGIAAAALGELGEKAATEEIITALIVALKDRDAFVRVNAAGALGKLGEKAATEEIITALITALKDPDDEARSSISEALGQLGERAATDEIITALITVLKDPDDEVRSNAAKALGQLSEKVVTDEIIRVLTAALKVPNSEIRSGAAKALGQLGEKAATDEIIDALIVALKDPKNYVRRDAVEALGKLGEKAATNKVIRVLTAALKSRDKNVERAATSALGKLGEKTTIPEVITILIAAFQGQNENVRRGAAEALQKLSKVTWVAKTRILSELIKSFVAMANIKDKNIPDYFIQNYLRLFFEITNYCPLVISENRLIFSFDRDKSFSIPLRNEEYQRIITLFQQYLGFNNFSVPIETAKEQLPSSQQRVSNMPGTKKIFLSTPQASSSNELADAAITTSFSEEHVRKPPKGLSGSVQVLQVTKPRASFKQKAKVKDVLFKQIPDGLVLGKATDQGDCFFDALAQCMNQIHKTDVNTTKYLRSLCHDFYLKNKAIVDQWNLKDWGGIDKGKDDYYFVQYTAEECERDFHGRRTPIWGRSHVEGMILCHQLNLKGLCIIEILEDPYTQQPVVSFNLVAKDACKSISVEEAQAWINNPYIPTLVVEQKSLHFVPLLFAEQSVEKTAVTSFDDSLSSWKPQSIIPAVSDSDSTQRVVSVKKYLLQELLEIKDKYGELLTSPRLHLQHTVRLAFKKFLIEKLMPFLREHNLYSATQPKSIFMSYAWAIEGSPTYGRDKIYEGYVEKIAKDLERIGCKVYLDRWFDQPGNVLTDFLELMGKSDFFISIGTYLYLSKYEKRVELENSEEHEHVVRTEGQILSYIANHSSHWQKRIMPILLEGSSEKTLPLILRPQLPITLHKEDYFDKFFAMAKKIYGIDNRNKEFEKLVKGFYQIIKGLTQSETDLEQHIQTLKRNGSPLHQVPTNPSPDLASSSVSSVAASSTTLHSERGSSPNFP